MKKMSQPEWGERQPRLPLNQRTHPFFPLSRKIAKFKKIKVIRKTSDLWSGTKTTPSDKLSRKSESTSVHCATRFSWKIHHLANDTLWAHGKQQEQLPGAIRVHILGPPLAVVWHKEGDQCMKNVSPRSCETAAAASKQGTQSYPFRMWHLWRLFNPVRVWRLKSTWMGSKLKWWIFEKKYTT